MRIAYLTGTYPRATDTFIQREIFALRDRGVEVFTFGVRAPNPEHLVGPEQREEHKRTFYILPPTPGKLLGSHLSLLMRSPGRYLSGVKLAWQTSQAGLRGFLYQMFYFLEAGILAHEIQRQKIQHLHNHLGDSSCSVAMLAAEVGDFSFSFTLHGPYIFYNPYFWRLDTKILKAKFVSCISYFCRSQAMFFVPLAAWDKLKIVHCGVEPELFNPVEHQGEGNRLLYVGRLSAAKGLPVLLESLVSLRSQFPQLQLTVVGDGEDRAELEALTQELGLAGMVNYVGYKSQTEVREVMQQTDVFVLPSFAEGVPVALMEAMAAQVPVVTTRIAGISELVDDGVSGYLVPPGSKTALREAIANLVAKPERRNSFGQAGRAKVEREFDVRLEANRLYEILHTALVPATDADESITMVH
ncbi:MAG: glycosyltransferase family 4 protein [Spirulina sp. SIO3F2]|nr:glycosyltransferase family 4 protein [Spirulina sp. SIO3F2]